MKKWFSKSALAGAAILVALTAQAVPAFAASGSSAPVSSAGGSLDFNAAPTAKSTVNPSIVSYFYDKGVPGQSLQESLALTNLSKIPETIHLFSVTSSTGLNGGIIFGNTADTTWITNLPSDVTLAPGKTQDVPFTVSVPAGTKPGDYTFGLSMEDHPPSSMSQTKNKNFSVQLLRQIRRVVAVEVEIPGPVSGQAVIQGSKIILYPSGVFLDIYGNNTGSLISTYNGSIVIKGKGQKPATFTINQAELDSFSPFQFEYKWQDGHPAIGTYYVTVNMTDGTHVIDKTTSFTVSGQQLQKAQQLTGQTMIASVVPSWVYLAGGVLVLVIVGLFLAFFFLLRKTKKKD